MVPTEALGQGLGGKDHAGSTAMKPPTTTRTDAQLCPEPTLVGLESPGPPPLYSLCPPDPPAHPRHCSHPTPHPLATGARATRVTQAALPGGPRSCPFPVFEKAAIYLTIYLILSNDVLKYKYFHFYKNLYVASLKIEPL